MASPQTAQAPGQPASYLPTARASAEKKMGMHHSMSATKHGWQGEVRKRFTDFQVNERRKDGEVLHLVDYESGERPAGVNIHIPGQNNKPSPAPDAVVVAPARVIPDEDKAILQSLLGEATTSSVLNLYAQTVASGSIRLDPKANAVKFPPMDREVRGKVHNEIRRIFESKIETETDKEGIINAIPATPRQNRKSQGRSRNKRSNQPSFDDLGGDYLHFTLYKENKDTMDAVNQIGRIIKVRGNNFGFAGTKDRRAATVQRMSVFRVRHQVLDFLNSQMPAFKMGDYKYSKYPIQLGDHGGNHFKITVKGVTLTSEEGLSLERRVQLIQEAVEHAVTNMSKHGFINYYGLQRFGTHAVGTHELGMLMMNEDYEGVANGLLHVDKDLMAQVIAGTVVETPMNRDDINRTRAIVQFKSAKNASAALDIMPRRFHAETTIIEHLQKNSRDFAGAILKITRGMRNLYLHAYQSYVWNHAASHRWATYGSKVVPGDLVIVTTDNTAPEDIEEDAKFQRARALSEEEAEGGQYTIFDVVLPGPGFDVEYPKNDIGDFYVNFMKKPENGGLDPHRMRRPIKDFNISGTYRPLLGRFRGEPKWQVRTYLDDNEQMVPTDLDLIMIRKAEEKEKAQKQETAAPPTGTVRRREDDAPELQLGDGESSAQTAAQPSSKRMKFTEESSRTSEPDSVTPVSNGAAAAASAAGADASNGPTSRPAEPSAVPNGSAGSADSKDDASTDALAEKPQEDLPMARFGSGAIHSFAQADLSQHTEDQVKIAVVLGFGLSTSAYATVVLRELMAEVEPEKPGSPLPAA
ncbi:unnamed protein product [Discula destructiva]